jgi:hypothetical protein
VAASDVPLRFLPRMILLLGKEGAGEPDCGLGKAQAPALDLVGVCRRVVEDNLLALLSLFGAETRVENLRKNRKVDASS